MSHRSLAALAALAALTLSACGATTVVGETTTTASTTTTLPSGTPAVLLPRLVVTVRQISEEIIKVGGNEDTLIEQAEDIWSVVEPEVRTTDGAAADSMQAMMDLARVAVDRTRPADADKANKFLTQLVDKYLAEHPA